LLNEEFVKKLLKITNIKGLETFKKQIVENHGALKSNMFVNDKELIELDLINTLNNVEELYERSEKEWLDLHYTNSQLIINKQIIVRKLG